MEILSLGPRRVTVTLTDKMGEPGDFEHSQGGMERFPSVDPEQPWGNGPKAKARGAHTGYWGLDSIPGQ